MKKHKVLFLSLSVLIVLSLACSFSGLVPTAVPTDTPQPTVTPYPTPIPPTATPEPTLTKAPVPGIDDYVFYDGVNMRVSQVYFLESLNGPDGETKPPDPTTQIFMAIDFQAFGTMGNIDIWADEMDINKYIRVQDDLGNVIPWSYYVYSADEGWLSLVYVVPSNATVFTLVFPDDQGTMVDLSPFLGQ